MDGLDDLLQAPLGVRAAFPRRQARRKVAVDPENGPPRGLEASVDVHGADHGLERILEGGVSAPAAARLLVRAEAQAGVEADLAGEAREELAPAEDRAPLGELALRGLGIERIERLRQDQLEDGVAEELEALVVARRGGAVLQPRGVGERAFEEGRVAERVPDPPLERLWVARHELALV